MMKLNILKYIVSVNRIHTFSHKMDKIKCTLSVGIGLSGQKLVLTILG